MANARSVSPYIFCVIAWERQFAATQLLPRLRKTPVLRGAYLCGWSCSGIVVRHMSYVIQGQPSLEDIFICQNDLFRVGVRISAGELVVSFGVWYFRLVHAYAKGSSNCYSNILDGQAMEMSHLGDGIEAPCLHSQKSDGKTDDTMRNGSTQPGRVGVWWRTVVPYRVRLRASSSFSSSSLRWSENTL